MLRIEFRRPIIPPCSFTVAINKRKKSTVRLCWIARSLGLRQLCAPPSVQLPVNFPPRSSVNRLFTGFDGLQCFDLWGFVHQCVCVCVEGLQMLLCSAGGGGQCVIEKTSCALACRDVHLQRRLVCKHIVRLPECTPRRRAFDSECLEKIRAPGSQRLFPATWRASNMDARGKRTII